MWVKIIKYMASNLLVSRINNKIWKKIKKLHAHRITRMRKQRLHRSRINEHFKLIFYLIFPIHLNTKLTCSENKIILLCIFYFVRCNMYKSYDPIGLFFNSLICLICLNINKWHVIIFDRHKQRVGGIKINHRLI